jgi:hypothetical protein
MGNKYKILFVKSERKGSFCGPSFRREDNIKVVDKETYFENANYINLSRNNELCDLVNTAINFQFP